FGPVFLPLLRREVVVAPARSYLRTCRARVRDERVLPLHCEGGLVITEGADVGEASREQVFQRQGGDALLVETHRGDATGAAIDRDRNQGRREPRDAFGIELRPEDYCGGSPLLQDSLEVRPGMVVEQRPIPFVRHCREAAQYAAGPCKLRPEPDEHTRRCHVECVARTLLEVVVACMRGYPVYLERLLPAVRFCCRGDRRRSARPALFAARASDE